MGDIADNLTADMQDAYALHLAGRCEDHCEWCDRPGDDNRYVVMDSRAQYDPHAAIVLEAYDTRPSMRELKRAWGRQGAVLMRLSPDKNGRYYYNGCIQVIP